MFANVVVYGLLRGLARNLVNNYGQRKSARTFASKQEASNKLYTVLPHVIFLIFPIIIHSIL
jgi:hypothetical protein